MIVAAVAIENGAAIVACVLPLVIALLLLRRPTLPADDSFIAETLIGDLMVDRPLLGHSGEAARHPGDTDSRIVN